MLQDILVSWGIPSANFSVWSYEGGEEVTTEIISSMSLFDMKSQKIDVTVRLDGTKLSVFTLVGHRRYDIADVNQYAEAEIFLKKLYSGDKSVLLNDAANILDGFGKS